MKNKTTMSGPGPMGLRWDRADKATRIAWIKKDPSMNHPRWTALADRWASRSWAEMSGLEREATIALFSAYSHS